MKKIHTFNARFRQSVDRVMSDMGLIHIGSTRQVNNGTLMYLDPETRCLYALYESGYIRRFTPVKLYGAYRKKSQSYAMYQLNPTHIGKTLHKRLDGTYSEYEHKKRTLLNPIEQLGRVTIAITNYRNK